MSEIKPVHITEGHDWTLFHGDAIDILANYSGRTNLCFTSPSPYRGADQTYGIGSESIVTHYIQNLLSLFDGVYKILTNDGNLVVNMVDPYNPDLGGMVFLPERFALMMLQSGRWLCKSKVVWQRPFSGTWKEKRFRPDWEYVYVFSKSKDSFFDSSNVAAYTSIFEYHLSGLGFPIGMLRMFIQSLCPEHGIVLDPLCSTASTGIEALRLDRRFIGIEIVKERYKIAVENLRKADIR